MVGKEQVSEIVAAARRRNEARDREDRKAGFLPASEDSTAGVLRTAIMALECAIGGADWEVVAEAYVFLQDLHSRLTGRPYGVKP